MVNKLYFKIFYHKSAIIQLKIVVETSLIDKISHDYKLTCFVIVINTMNILLLQLSQIINLMLTLLIIFIYLMINNHKL